MKPITRKEKIKNKGRTRKSEVQARKVKKMSIELADLNQRLIVLENKGSE